MKWFVIKTKPNSEIKIADSLNRLGIKAFCPVISFLKQYSDRKKKVFRPALPSYVLVYTDEKRRSDVFNIPGVVRYLFWQGKPAEVKDHEINSLQNEIDNLHSVSKGFQLEKNGDYTLNSGPFKGITGKVLNISNNRFKLELKSIGIYVTLNLA